MMFSEQDHREFIGGYTDAMKWANTIMEVGDDPETSDIESFDAANDIRVWNFDHASMVRIVEVCDDFLRAAEPMLRAATMISAHDKYGPRDMSDHGHDFALTQNHHGAGFWDRGYPSVLGDALTDAAQGYGEATAYASASDATGTLIYEG